MIIFWLWESFSDNIHLCTVCLGMEIFILCPEVTVLRICKTGVENGTLANVLTVSVGKVWDLGWLQTISHHTVS